MAEEHIQHALGRIETKLDTLLTRDDDKETRIRSLERSRWTERGVYSTLAALVGYFIRGR